MPPPERVTSLVGSVPIAESAPAPSVTSPERQSSVAATPLSSLSTLPSAFAVSVVEDARLSSAAAS